VYGKGFYLMGSIFGSYLLGSMFYLLINH